MKRLFTVLLACLMVGAVQSQGYLENCTVDRFSYVQAYAQPQGGGIEVGVWPQESVFKPKVAGSTELVQSTTVAPLMYTTGIARVNRYVYGTGRVGINDLDRLYLGVGLRLSLPVSSTPCSVLVEPQYSTLGFNTTAGFGLAF
jgi:hypothetical protein